MSCKPRSRAELPEKRAGSDVLVTACECAHPEFLDLANRLALRPEEAAAALGIGERTLRQILPELPHFYVGRRVLLPVEALRAWAAEQATSQVARSDAIADEVISAFSQPGDD